jgi:hypothetical protein
MGQPRNLAPTSRAAEPGYRIVRTYRPNLERQIAALCLVLGIPTPPPLPSPTPPASRVPRSRSRLRRSADKEVA